jgi:hypothetical protein
MRIDLATLRQRAALLLGSHQLWQRSALASAQEPALPSCTSRIFKLAQIAVGDAESAAVLAADVFARHLREPQPDEDVLVRTMLQHLPTGWLGWPSETGPGEWLPLGIRHELADRLLSLLGEWTPQDRIALALYLLWDVRRDDLDSWIGSAGMGERIGLRINGVGQSLGLISLNDISPACAEHVDDLVDADDPQIGRSVRYHTLGCEACRQRVAGLRKTARVLRTALTVFFRAQPPALLPRLILERRRVQQRIPIKRWHVWTASALVFLLLLRSISGQSTTSAAGRAGLTQPGAAPTAALLVEHALDRFGSIAPSSGVLHERIRFTSRDETLILERWYDYAAPQRLRVTVRRPGTTAPILDLSTDGASRIAYQLDRSYRTPANALVQDNQVRALMPLLRQLPYTGGLGDARIDQRFLDLTLLAQVRRAGATRLGTTLWQGRPATLLSSAAADGARTILTIDQATASLLQARIVPATGGSATARTVWEADVFELVTRAEMPRGVFELSPRETVLPKINPRQFMLSPLSNLDVNSALAISRLPAPQQLPEPSILAYVRSRDRSYTSIIQMYESLWSSVAIVIPWRNEERMNKPLDHSFAHGRYSELPSDLPNVTALEFSMNGIEDVHMRLYLWHGLADDAERATLAQTILDSLTLVDARHPLARQMNFVEPSGRGRPDSLIQFGSTGSGQAFIRSKSRQLLQLELGPFDTPAFLSR